MTAAPIPSVTPDKIHDVSAVGELVLRLTGATLAFEHRTLWADVDLELAPGEFVAVLGANGSGKSSLLRAVLGEIDLTAGDVELSGTGQTRRPCPIGYVPQQTAVDPVTPVTVADLVRFGVNGHRWGTGIAGARAARRRVHEMLAAVGAAHLAARPVQELSGGELQRVRVAQALAGEPALLLADEPLAALDLAQAQSVVRLIDDYRRAHGTAVLFITHDINAVLGVADRVLYLAGGRFKLGTPDEVLTSAVLTDLYGAPVDVFHAQGRIVVVAATDPGADHDDVHGHYQPLHAPDEGTSSMGAN